MSIDDPRSNYNQDGDVCWMTGQPLDGCYHCEQEDILNTVVWSAEVTEGMVEWHDDDQREALFKALNDAVRQVCQDWGM